MQKRPFLAGDALPTIYRAYKPIEEYLEALHEADEALAPVQVASVDALIVHLLVSLCPKRPILVDLAGEATHGTSTVLCCTQSRASKVVRPPLASQSDSSWPSLLTRFLDQCEACSFVAPQEMESGKSLFDPPRHSELFSGLTPTVFVTAAQGETPEELANQVRNRMEWRPNGLVLVLALGETGQCEYVKTLSTVFDCQTPQRFVLLRERAAALHASTLGLIYNRAHPDVDDMLARLAALFTGNFSFLNLVKKACVDAIRTADVDNSLLEAHPLGALAGTRRRIAELEQELLNAGEEARNLQQTIATRDQALAVRDQALAASREEMRNLEQKLAGRKQALAARDLALLSAGEATRKLQQAFAAREQALVDAGKGTLVLQQALTDRIQELGEVRRTNSELVSALTAANKQIQEFTSSQQAITNSLTFQMATRFRTARMIAAPNGSLRHRLFQQMLGVIQVSRLEGLRGILSRMVKKVMR